MARTDNTGMPKRVGTEPEELVVVFPEGAFGAWDGEPPLVAMLRRVAVAASGDPGQEWAEKYGTDIDNDVFQMHRDCSCQKDDCLWCGASEQHPGRFDVIQLPPYRSYSTTPHFWHKASGFGVCWYKYIGRDMEMSFEPTDEQIATIERECLASLARP